MAANCERFGAEHFGWQPGGSSKSPSFMLCIGEQKENRQRSRLIEMGVGCLVLADVVRDCRPNITGWHAWPAGVATAPAPGEEIEVKR
jgi:hypothetical protein